ncbi:hypothetical protein F5Y08DRAFT_258090 [Xylaria arbuscula]|uniref:Uncharacterized protein n=1 Tax=Xylaria arbuscula TaxID=114810 RepID=A0A9W8TSL4_9PEZI|nr:hypothetical protein F5Y08DRAFT_258090 [Xylaria arbuscula]KAJ3580496.1 hypothetical protein NPX13_g51 [Xylaria arbuscula]
MEPLEILLFEGGDPNSGFRTKNAEGDKARGVLIDRGDVLALRARLVSVTHGDYTPNGDAATLLVFEFDFLSMKQSRRFKTANITLTFEDASGNLRNRPEVVAIAPAGKFFINKTIDKRDVKQSVNTSLNGSFAGIGGSVGYVWDMSQTKEADHATTLVGTKRLFADWGKDNGVRWNLEEDGVKSAGIPTFLRAAVLLRRRDDVPFRFTIQVETGVDFDGRVRRMLGLEKPEAVDPVELDNGTNLDDLGIASLNPNAEGVDLRNMAGMDIGRNADVMLASLLTLQG